MLIISLSCDAEGCDEYEEASASLSDGVNAIEPQTDGWQMDEHEQFCPAHRNDSEETSP